MRHSPRHILSDSWGLQSPPTLSLSPSGLILSISEKACYCFSQRKKILLVTLPFLPTNEWFIFYASETLHKNFHIVSNFSLSTWIQLDHRNRYFQNSSIFFLLLAQHPFLLFIFSCLCIIWYRWVLLTLTILKFFNCRKNKWFITRVFLSKLAN